jgi:hypothetical protein
MHDEMGVHAQDVGACAGCNRACLSSHAAILGMVGRHEDLGRFQASWAALRGLVTFSLPNTTKVIGEPSDSYFQPIDCKHYSPFLLLTNSAAFALTLSTPRSSPCFSSNASHFLNKT